MPNLDFIKEYGLEKFMEQQRTRIAQLETMIKKFNDGRSRSFYCKAAGSLDPESLKKSLDKATNKIKADKIKPDDLKNKAKILKTILSTELNIQSKPANN